jgi:hypothetical protein
MGWIPPQSAKYMSVKQISDELDVLAQRWRELRESLEDEGMSGSPGEYLVERMGELETELNRRLAPALSNGEHRAQD